MGYQYLLHAKENGFAPALCFLAEGYLLGYWNKEVDINASKELLTYARDQLKSFKASIMLENMEKNQFSFLFENLKKQLDQKKRGKIKELLYGMK
jgi:hypothetical protein